MSKPLRQIVETIVSNDLSPAARQRIIADFARRKLAEGVDQNRRATGREVPYTQAVDGRLGARLESVNADAGRILFMFDVAKNELFVWIAEQIVKHAPRGVITHDHGRYADAFKLLAGGREMQPGEPLPKADEFVFLNAMPYARKIERGLSKQAPDGVLQAVALLAKTRFKDVANITFGYRSYMGGPVSDWAKLRRPSKTGYSRRKRDAALAKDIRQPAIIVRLY
ncbi:hypothetical protein [Methylopila sp. 73B]|uniref:hypothetical protein n=1 Tax=Methylopila sp. 73B TaxID=1120792 RepID=UPI000367F0C9|nr:hypothetical protein [Methylopila sp. 73B]